MKYEPALGTVFLPNYTNALSPHLVMTAGAGWIGEINNQFNKTKYNFPAIAGSVIPPYIVWDGQHTLTKWGTQGSWLQSINRKLGIAIVNNWLWSKGRNTFNIGIDFRRSYQDDNEEQTEGGQFSFSQRTTSVPNTSDPNFGKYGSCVCQLPARHSGPGQSSQLPGASFAQLGSLSLHPGRHQAQSPG